MAREGRGERTACPTDSFHCPCTLADANEREPGLRDVVGAAHDERTGDVERRAQSEPEAQVRKGQDGVDEG